MRMAASAPLLASAAAIGVGSFGALIRSVRCDERTTILLLNAWTAIGGGIASLPLWIFYGQHFTVRGVLLGAALGASTTAYFSAIGDLGLTVASALTCGIGCLVSSICNVQIQNQVLQHKSVGAAAVFLAVISLAGTAMTGRYNMFIHSEAAAAIERAHEREDESEVFETLHSRELAEETVSDPLNTEGRDERAPAFGVGLAAGILAGLLGGCVAGLTALSDQAAVASGFVLTSLIMVTVSFWCNKLLVSFAILSTIPAGVFSGLAFFAGNICRLLSVKSSAAPELNYAILSSTVLMAAAWGIVYYREMTPRTLPACLISGIGLVLGTTMLGVASLP